MIKRVFIIHGWDGYPQEGWFPWLKQELEKRNFKVDVLAMPQSDAPTIHEWVAHLETIVGEVDEHTFFIGHSIGCQTILRYLESLPIDEKIGGAVFVAGWLTLMNLETEEEWKIAKPWIETPIDFKKIKNHTSCFNVILSDNDPFVPLENKELFEQRLGAHVSLEHAKGHFREEDGIFELPSILHFFDK